MTSSPSSSTAHPRSEASPLERLAEEFTRRVRAGERVGAEEYARANPALAREIRAFFPTIEALERAAAPGLAGGATPARIGEYEVVREIGRGGMGVVLLAEQTSLGRRVALKLLPPQASLDPRFLERFRREARAVARLQHPHIVQVYGVGEDRGLHYYAMQYIEGVALDRVIRAFRRIRRGNEGGTETIEVAARALLDRHGRGIPDERPSQASREGGGSHDVYFRNVVHIVRQVADALAYAHKSGVLHRDVKPGNLLMDSRGSVWITDFGLCRVAEDDNISGSRDLVGTLRYMSPEQIGGREDVRSDVYGLGVTLYELLTLRPAFDDESRGELVQRIQHHYPPRPRRVQPYVPRDLEAIVLKAIAKDPGRRYATAEAFAADLVAFLENRPIVARLPSPLYLTRLTVRRNKLLSATIGAALLLLVLVSSIYVGGLRAAREEETRQAYIASLAAAESSLRANDTDTARRRLEAAPEALRGWEWFHFRSRLDESLSTIARLDAPVFSVATSPDGRLAAAGGRGRVSLWNLDSGELVWSLEGLSQYVPDVDFDPAGRRLVIADSGGEVVVASVQGGPESAVRRALGADVHAARFDPSGETVAVGLGDGTIRLLDVDLEEVARLPGHEGRVLCLAFAPDGAHLVAGSAAGPLRVWSLETRTSRLSVGHTDKVRSVAVSPDGALAASASADGTIRIREFATGRELQVLQEHAAQVDDVAFSADGRLLVSCSLDHTLRVWESRSGELIRTLRGPARGIRCIAFRGTSGRIVSGAWDGTLREWDVRASGGQLVCTGHLGDLWDLDFDDSGELLASCGRDTTVRLWDAATGAPLRLFLGHEQGVQAVALSPDGTLVVSGDRGGGLSLWDVGSGTRIAELERAADDVFDESHAVLALAFHPAGTRFFAGRQDGRIQAWDVERKGLEREVERGAPVGALDVHPDGSLLGAGSDDGSLLVLGAEDLAVRHELRPHRAAVSGVSFAPRGDRLASVSHDGSLALVRVSSGTVERVVVVEEADQADEVRSLKGVAFSADGTRLATASSSSSVVLWDPESGAEVARFHDHETAVTAVAFGAHGRLASGCWKGDVRLWDTASAQARLARLEARVQDGPDAREGDAEHLLADCWRLLVDPDVSERDARRAYWLAAGLAHSEDRRQEYQVAKGAALLRCGRLAGARRELVTALGMSRPEDAVPELPLVLALTCARLGRPEDAAAALEDARSRGLDRAQEPTLRRLWSEAERVVAEVSSPGATAPGTDG